MTILDIAREFVGEPKRNGSAYNSPCPFCGGNQRFVMWPDKGEHGAYWCRQCDKKGDAINLLMEKKGMSFKEAAAFVGKALTKQRAHTPREPKRAADWLPREVSAPADLWQARASAFAEACHKTLLGNHEQLAWLAARGITVESVKRFKLGWNPKALFRKRPTWGLEIKKEVVNGAEKLKEWLCLSQGLVIPCFVDGQINRLRIRKPEGEPRYIVVPTTPPGSGMGPMIIPPAALPGRRGAAWVIVESELDALLLAQDAGELVGAAALGSVSTRPDGSLFDALKAADSILVALDFDDAGAKSWPWWQTHFPQADRWVVPHGKDPGDYRKAGGDIRAWVVAGLPPGLRPAPPVIASCHEQSQGETKAPQDETNGAETETGTGTCQKGLNADFAILVDVVTPEIIASQEPGNIILPEAANRSEAEPLLPYDGTWPPITKEQAREMGCSFHEISCETCGKPTIFLWPLGKKPPLEVRCYDCPKQKPAERGKK